MRGCFDIRERSIQELRDQKVVTTKHIPREFNMADLLTHCLSRSAFQKQLTKTQNFERYNCRGACLQNFTFSLQLYSPDDFY